MAFLATNFYADIPVADPGFDPMESVGVCLAIFLLKLCLKLIASEGSEKHLSKIGVLGIKNRSAAVRGGGRRMRPLDPLVYSVNFIMFCNP